MEVSIALGEEASLIDPKPVAPGISRTRKAGQVYALLRQDIVLARLKPGEPLLEIALARRFGTSQGTVREALMRLAEDGLVVRHGYRGTRVSAISADEARELLSLRVHLETLSFARVAEALPAGLPAALEERVAAMETAARAGDDYALVELDHDFHLAIFRQARLPVMEPVLSRCILHMHRMAFTERGRTRSLLTSAQRHWQVVEALTSREAARASATIESHIATVWQAGPQGQETG